MVKYFMVNSSKVNSSNKKGFFLLWIFALFSLFSINANAETIATVSKNVVEVNSAFQLQITTNKNVNVDSLDLSPLQADFLMGRPSVSNSMRSINGKFSRETRWTVAIAAKKVGNLTIPPLTIAGDQTAPITIRAMKSTDNVKADNQDIVVHSQLDKKTLYVGESTNLKLTVMIGVQTDSASITAPQGNGLTVKQTGKDNQYRTVVNGRTYIVLERIYQVMATEASTTTLHGAEFQASKIQGGQNPFSSSLAIPIAKKASDIDVEVLAKPEGVKGLWLPTSKLTLTQDWQPDVGSQEPASTVTNSKIVEAKIGEPVTRTIKLMITGFDSTQFPDINIQYPNSVKVYPEKAEYQQQGNAMVMTLKKAIIPRQAGDISLPSLTVNWFDTINKKSQTATIDGLTLKVTQDKSAAINNNGGSHVSSTPVIANQTQADQKDKSVNTDVNVANKNSVSLDDYRQLQEKKNSLEIAVFILAGLWLITLFLCSWLWLKSKKQPSSLSLSNDIIRRSDTNSIGKLIDALLRGASIEFRTLYRHSDFSTLDSELLSQIQQQVTLMEKAQFSRQENQDPEQPHWDKEVLLGLLKRAQKQQSKKGLKGDNNSQSLAELEP
ncbi:BatD family protein [Vibrio sp. SS-MA-C1-2]|uniref:BatD family protein n=1 Tax=Vibrio sp. SS-MA-C1-2 TaxID=2908646 RepID=UPI001F361F62|nr:BatD family protein [Vibrio sp. SS-MA-C1-2]UJF18582.1 BatD family protein [Vibrio sp. SS-MA-C1-2]